MTIARKRMFLQWRKKKVTLDIEDILSTAIIFKYFLSHWHGEWMLPSIKISIPRTRCNAYAFHCHRSNPFNQSSGKVSDLFCHFIHVLLVLFFCSFLDFFFHSICVTFGHFICCFSELFSWSCVVSLSQFQKNCHVPFQRNMSSSSILKGRNTLLKGNTKNSQKDFKCTSVKIHDMSPGIVGRNRNKILNEWHIKTSIQMGTHNLKVKFHIHISMVCRFGVTLPKMKQTKTEREKKRKKKPTNRIIKMWTVITFSISRMPSCMHPAVCRYYYLMSYCTQTIEPFFFYFVCVLAILCSAAFYFFFLLLFYFLLNKSKTIKGESSVCVFYMRFCCCCCCCMSVLYFLDTLLVLLFRARRSFVCKKFDKLLKSWTEITNSPLEWLVALFSNNTVYIYIFFLL